MNDYTNEENDRIIKGLTGLRKYRKKHIELGKRMVAPYEGEIYGVDILATAAIHRSLNLLLGFCDLIERRNIISAAPLLRLQIDNCLRMHAVYIVKKPHDFAIAVIRGTPVRKQKDQSGKFMTDLYLCKLVSKEHPWVSRVYGTTSGYVHLSEKHIFNAVRSGKSGDRSIELRIGWSDPFVPTKLYIEGIEAFKAATDLFFTYIEGWIYTKETLKR